MGIINDYCKLMSEVFNRAKLPYLYRWILNIQALYE